MAYTPPTKYTEQQLMRFYVKDLIVDIRCALRDGLPEYAEKCRMEVTKLFRNRHRARIDRYGMPKVQL